MNKSIFLKAARLIHKGDEKYCCNAIKFAARDTQEYKECVKFFNDTYAVGRQYKYYTFDELYNISVRKSRHLELTRTQLDTLREMRVIALLLTYNASKS